jgi:hypothetical protein
MLQFYGGRQATTATLRRSFAETRINPKLLHRVNEAAQIVVKDSNQQPGFAE